MPPAGFVLDALEPAIHDRRPVKGAGLVAHSDRGSQYLAIRDTERLAEAGIGLFKTEVIRQRGPWRALHAVEFATLEGVDWFNDRRRLAPIGLIPPAEAEAAYYAQIDMQPRAA